MDDEPIKSSAVQIQSRDNHDISLEGELIDKYSEHSFYYENSNLNPKVMELKNKIRELTGKQDVNVLKKDGLISTGKEKDIEPINLEESFSKSMELEDLLISYEDLLKDESDKYQYEMNNIKVENPKRNALRNEISELNSENRRLIAEINELSSIKIQ
jgi:hypothetical protein